MLLFPHGTNMQFYICFLYVTTQYLVNYIKNTNKNRISIVSHLKVLQFHTKICIRSLKIVITKHRSLLGSMLPHHRIEINRKATRVGTSEVCVSTHVSLRMFFMQVLASQLPSLANRNAELAVPPLFWPVMINCIKIGGHVALLSGATVYSLYCDHTTNKNHYILILHKVFSDRSEPRKGSR